MSLSKNIVFVGMMGSGKSHVSKKLGVILKRDVLSTDALIEQRENLSVAEIFKQKGEKYFRDLERKIVQEIAQKKNAIIDCGGGVVLNSDNIADLKRNGTVFYLKASPEFLYQCLKNTKDRPLLNVSDPLARIKEILKERQSKYEQADIVLNTTDKTVDEIVQDVLKAIKND